MFSIVHSFLKYLFFCKTSGINNYPRNYFGKVYKYLCRNLALDVYFQFFFLHNLLVVSLLFENLFYENK